MISNYKESEFVIKTWQVNTQVHFFMTSIEKLIESLPTPLLYIS